MTQDLDLDKIVAGVVRYVLQMEQAYLDLLLELYPWDGSLRLPLKPSSWSIKSIVRTDFCLREPNHE